MRNIHLIIWALCLLVFSGGCVSKKKYDQELSARMNAERRENQLKQELESMRSQLSTRIDQYNELSAQRDRLQAERDQLDRNLRQFTDRALSQQQQLDLALAQQQQELQERQREIDDLRERIRRRDDMMNNLLSTVQNALKQYNSDELSVEMRDGKVYVSLSDNMLFASGSAQVERRGKEALGTLAGVLKQQPNMEVLVEGHTDSIPIRSATFKDNWDLSVLRATSVVRILTKDYGVNPTQVTAAGRGEYFPRASNASREGRASNRRTEIIIQPRLDEIYQALQSSTLNSGGG